MITTQKNLIFLQRSRPNRPEGVSETILVVNNIQLPVTNLITDDFANVYSALSESKLKLPARVLRFCKEQLYELVALKEPSEKLCLTDINEITNREDIEFVVGLGVAGSQMKERGYLGMTARELFSYVISDKPKLDGKAVLEQTMPVLDNKKNYLPVFRFLREAGLSTLPVDINQTVCRLASCGRDRFKTDGYAKAAARETAGKDFNWIVNNIVPEKAAAFIPHLSDDRIPLDELQQFIQKYFEKAFAPPYSTFYRKLFCLYDFLKFGGTDFRRQVPQDSLDS